MSIAAAFAVVCSHMRTTLLIFQSPRRIDVAHAIRFDLLSPELSVAFWPSYVLWATVPPAPIDEHCETDCWENDIHLASNIRRQLSMDIKAQTSCVKQRTDLSLECGIALTLPLHALAH
jgi:hypothetical protein